MAEHAFISYVRENSEIVDRLAAELRENGVEVWLDRDDILPGEYWQDAISKAITSGAFFIACFSSEMNSRAETYMHGELRLAVDRLRAMPRERIWFVPLMLNETKIPNHPISGHESLADINTINLFRDWAGSVKSILRVMGVEDKDVQKIRRIRKAHLDNGGKDTKLATQLMETLRQIHGRDSPLIRGMASKNNEIRSKTIDFFRNSHRASFEVLDYFDEIGRYLSTLSNHFTDNSDLMPREASYVELLETVSSVGPYLDYLTSDLEKVVRSAPTYTVTYSTIRATGRIGTVESGALQILKDMAVDTSFEHQDSAIYAIGDFGRYGADALSALRSVYDECTRDCKLSLLYTVGRIKHIGEDDLEFLIRALSDDDEDIREGAIKSLCLIARAQVHNQRISEALVPLLKDGSARVRAETVEALTYARRDVPDLVEGIMGVLDDRDSRTVNKACSIIAGLGPRAKAAAPKLQKLLVSSNKQNLEQVIDALGEIGPAAQPALDALISIYLGRDAALSERAYRAIEMIAWEPL